MESIWKTLVTEMKNKKTGKIDIYKNLMTLPNKKSMKIHVDTMMQNYMLSSDYDYKLSWIEPRFEGDNVYAY